MEHYDFSKMPRDNRDACVVNYVNLPSTPIGVLSEQF
jgi:hypothetical protein